MLTGNPNSPNFHQSLPQPYSSLDPDRDLSNLSALISYADKNLIKSICPKKGILNQITQNFFSSLTNQLRKHGITYYSPEHERFFVDLVTRGCAAFEPAGETSARYVLGRIASAHTGTPGSLQQPGDAQGPIDKREASGESTSEE